MVYAMFSIGILGFLVWSQSNITLASVTPYFFFNKNFGLVAEVSLMVALSYCKIGVINYAVCWNSLVPISTFNRKNLISYTQSAGNLYTAFALNFLFTFA